MKWFPVAMAGVVTAAGVATSAAVLDWDSVIAPSSAVTGFEEYIPPDYINGKWYDYQDGPGGSYVEYVTNYPIPEAGLPYRSVFVGADMKTSGTPGVNLGYIYVLYSRKPAQEYLTFTYKPNRANYGYILANFKDEEAEESYGYKSGEAKEWVLLYDQLYWNTKEGGRADFYSYGLTTWTEQDWSYHKGFSFDFYYQCCPHHGFGTPDNLVGVRNVTDIHYPYILTCTDTSGNGGGSEWGSSSSGSSGGGSSSGGSSGGGSSGGSSSGDENSRWPWESSSSSTPPPWEDSSNIPDFSSELPETSYSGGSEGDTGENGDTWELPGWGDELPNIGGDLNIPSLPEVSYPELPGLPDVSYPDLPGIPDVSMPNLLFPEYDGGDGGTWPPAFPGFGG